MRVQDGFPVATALQGILTKKYGFCHLFVSHKGYYLQTAVKGKIFAQTLPFMPTQANVDAILKAFADHHEPEKQQAQETTKEATPAVEQEQPKDDRPRRKTNRKSTST